MSTTLYRVNDLYPCIQGEGCLVGTAMVLLRLHGCPVGCPWCDTKETWLVDPAQQVASLAEVLGANPRWVALDADTLATTIAQQYPGPRWVLLTGGEPADQDLPPLVAALHRRGYRVVLETSGTALGHLGAGCDWVCVSPKIGMPGGRAVLPAALASADELKHVVGRAEDITRLDALLAAHQAVLKTGVQVCLQPVSLNPTATALCLQTVQERGWRLSLQVHKLLHQR